MNIRPARDDADLAAALAVREEVFVREQGVSLPADVDGRDGEADHFVAEDGDGSIVGTCRVLFEDDVAVFGRLSVLPRHRGSGLGAELLAAAEGHARAAGARTMRLHAQTMALSIYERAGYEGRGERFMDEGIEHLTMEKALR